MADDPKPDLDAAARVLDVLTLAEGLKRELRHSWLSDGRRESVAEHCYQMALFALLAAPHLEHRVDLARAIELILVHDLVEAIAGDVPFFETGARKDGKRAAEEAAIREIEARIGGENGARVRALWEEFETRETPEARFAVALDHLEVQHQHNLAALETWEEIERPLAFSKMGPWTGHDAFLDALRRAIEAAAEAKLRAAGEDADAIRARASET